MARLSLLHVVRPYFFVAMDLGPGVQDVLGLLHVDSYDAAWDDDGVVISGVARIDSDNPSSPVFSPFAAGAPPASGTSSSVWDWHDVAIRFRLTAARQPGCRPGCHEPEPTTARRDRGAGAGHGPGALRPPRHAVPPGPDVRAGVVTIPRLRGDKLQGHLLVPDPAHLRVKLQQAAAPRILLVVTQDFLLEPVSIGGGLSEATAWKQFVTDGRADARRLLGGQGKRYVLANR